MPRLSVRRLYLGVLLAAWSVFGATRAYGQTATPTPPPSTQDDQLRLQLALGEAAGCYRLLRVANSGSDVANALALFGTQIGNELRAICSPSAVTSASSLGGGFQTLQPTKSVTQFNLARSRIDQRLRSKTTAPKNPVRDPAGNLGEALAAALASSDALVPLCSPAAARSEWVNKEIRGFKALGSGARIFPVILSGTPRKYDPAQAPDGAFPPALFQRVDEAGEVAAEDDPDPLAADVRPEGDGFDLAKLKIVAGLTGIPLTELTERQQEAERRERRLTRAIAAVSREVAPRRPTAATCLTRAR